MPAGMAQERANDAQPHAPRGQADGADPTRMFQPDRIHPKAAAHPLMLANVWPELKKMLR